MYKTIDHFEGGKANFKYFHNMVNGRNFSNHNRKYSQGAEKISFFTSNQKLGIQDIQAQKIEGVYLKFEDRILEALWKDLRRSGEEASLTAISIVTGGIDLHIRYLKNWA